MDSNILLRLSLEVRQKIYDELIEALDGPGDFNVIAYSSQMPPNFSTPMPSSCAVIRPELILDSHDHGRRGMPCEFIPIFHQTGYVALAPRGDMLHLALTCSQLSDEVLAYLYQRTKICVFGTVLAGTNLPSAADILELFLSNIPLHRRQHCRNLEVASEGHQTVNVAQTAQVDPTELDDLCGAISQYLPNLRELTLAIDFDVNFPFDAQRGYVANPAYGILASGACPENMVTLFRRNRVNNSDITQADTTRISPHEVTRHQAQQDAIKAVLDHVRARIAHRQWFSQIEDGLLNLTLDMRSSWVGRKQRVSYRVCHHPNSVVHSHSCRSLNWS